MKQIFEVGQIVGSYRIVRTLGSGGMGVVYEVEHQKLKVRRALKVFAAENANVELHRKRFLIEGKMLSALDHPRVVRVHEFEVDSRTSLPYFVMDLVLAADGTPRTLEDERRAGADEQRAAKWFKDVCEGLDYVHSLGIAHRDVKLENILIGPDGHAVLSDFGISRIFDDALRKRLDVTVTMPQDDHVLRVLGSAYYMAPELLAANPAKASPDSDAWALGVMMYRLLSGIWFERESRANCLDVLDDYDLPWRTIIDRLCSEDASFRCPQAGFASLATSLMPAVVPERNHVRILAGAVALMAFLGFSGYFALSKGPQVPSKPELEVSAVEEKEEIEVHPKFEVIQVPSERQQAVRQAEEALFRRQFYDPVVAALEGEDETNRVAWACIRQTAEDMLHYMSGGVMLSAREHLGRGASAAWKKGCNYPAPVAYSYASYFKRTRDIQAAFGRVYHALDTDTRWNAASRSAFYSLMQVEDNAPANITDLEERLSQSLKEYLTSQTFTADELGGAYHTLAFFGKGESIKKAVSMAKEEGVVLDPWLETMLEAEIAYRAAWSARGSGMANTVSEEGRDVYNREIAKVLPLAEKAYMMRPDLPQSTLLALKTCYGSSREGDIWVKRLKASRYDLIAGYAQRLFGLRPRWCGSTEEMAQFLLELVREARYDTMVPIFAYERLVKDVFISEGGVRIFRNHFSTVDQFVETERDILEPYFEAYRSNGLSAKVSYLERVHIAVALADLAWRLGNADELLYWSDEVSKLGMPVVETKFKDGYLQYEKYLKVLRKLTGLKRKVFMKGLHALGTDGNREDIDAMAEIALEIGEKELALNSAISRRGKTDLKPYFFPKGSWFYFPTQTRDHLIFRVTVRGDGVAPSGKSEFKLIFGSRRLNPATDKYYSSKVNVGVCPGAESDPGQPVWHSGDETYSYEVEIVGDVARLTQNGRRIWERRLACSPSQCREFTVHTSVANGQSFDQIELEVRDDATFIIPSE